MNPISFPSAPTAGDFFHNPIIEGQLNPDKEIDEDAESQALVSMLKRGSMGIQGNKR